MQALRSDRGGEKTSALPSHPPNPLFIYFFCIFQASEGSRETSVRGRGARVTRDGRKIDLALACLKNAEKFSMFQFPIIQSVCPQILHKPLFLNAPGSIAFSQEHLKTISYAKFGGQTECIMGNWKIVNNAFSAGYRHSFFLGYDTHTFPLALVQRR